MIFIAVPSPQAREGAGGPCGVEDTELVDSDMSTLSKASSNYSKVSDEGNLG